MQGRVKRKQQQQAMAEAALRRADAESEGTCALCHRMLGAHVERHHTVPKSEGGNVTVPVHPICHRAIHAHLSNYDLAGSYADPNVLRAHQDIQRFLRWIANKPANFNAPTHRSRARREQDASHD